MFPGVAEAQAYQAKMMAESAQDPEAIMETYSKNIEFAGNMMQQAMNAGFMPEGLPDFSDGFDVYAGWEHDNIRAGIPGSPCRGSLPPA